jgi:hypothetical protein
MKCDTQQGERTNKRQAIKRGGGGVGEGGSPAGDSAVASDGECVVAALSRPSVHDNEVVSWVQHDAENCLAATRPTVITGLHEVSVRVRAVQVNACGWGGRMV